MCVSVCVQKWENVHKYSPRKKTIYLQLVKLCMVAQLPAYDML